MRKILNIAEKNPEKILSYLQKRNLVIQYKKSVQLLIE